MVPKVCFICSISLNRDEFVTDSTKAILKHLEGKPLTGDAVVDVAQIVPVVETTMDGTSGALFSIFLNALVHSLRESAPGDASPSDASPKVWAEALKRSCDALAKYTPARPGDRTLVDALYPFVEELGKTGDIENAAEASKNAALGTKGMKASLGRAVYVGGSGYEEVPDPGAWGLACFFLGLAGLKSEEKADLQPGLQSGLKPVDDEGWEAI